MTTAVTWILLWSSGFGTKDKLVILQIQGIKKSMSFIYIGKMIESRSTDV